MSRRALLGMGAMLPLSFAGCAPIVSDNGLRPDGRIRAATYITPGYTDLYPALKTFVDTVDKELRPEIVDFFDSGALLNPEQLVPGMLRGVTDIGFQTSSYVSTSFPILGAAELPFVNAGFDQLRRALAPDSGFSKLVNQQIAPQGLLDISSMPCTLEWLFTVDRPVSKPADLRGLRIRTAGHVEGQMIRALGGAPVSMASSELYEALERGTIDGMVSYLGTIISRGLQDILKYATKAHFGAYSVDAFANTAWYDKTGTDIRDALKAAGEVYYTQGTDIQLGVYEDDYLPQVEASAMETITPDEKETAEFRSAVSDVVEWWKKKIGDQELAERALRFIQEA